MSEHISLRDRLGALRGSREPEFEVSEDPTLTAFGKLFFESGLLSFDANKHLRTDALSPIYDCETESHSAEDAAPDKFVVIWTPVWAGRSPVTGFRSGQDSALLGSTPTVAMPQDERTAALLLLVTTPFVHLSGRRSAAGSIVQGAYLDEGNTYRFLALDPAEVAALSAAAAGA